jgi:hypothetical protein
MMKTENLRKIELNIYNDFLMIIPLMLFNQNGIANLALFFDIFKETACDKN